MPTIEVVHLGAVEYRAAWELQRRLVQERQEGRIGNRLLLLQHPPVITMGRRGGSGELLVPEGELRAKGVAVERVDRGGQNTCHSPGQLVGYPVLHLGEWDGSVRGYVRRLEESLIRACSAFGIDAGRIEGLTGVWAGDEKIAAIGVRISRWVTSHGFALNIANDLTLFSYIIPCGIRDRGVTSMQRLLPGQKIALEDVTPVVVRCFGEVFGAEMREGSGL
ncbi:MAG: lipoyl(octanoyl) transferase LipB [Armatimonadetes bacterium]|nr:lipoyl(octanoyl) transferase LipB [Armatimonadota bacterium]